MKRWSEVSARLGRNDKPTALWTSWDDLEPIDKPQALVDAWSGAEWPERQLGPYVWADLFDEVTGGFGEMYVHEEHDPNWQLAARLEMIDTLPEKTTLYRGCSKGREFGMAWTDDREQADWFAHRFGQMFGPPTIVTVEVPRAFVFARIMGARRENEWVLNIVNLSEVLGEDKFKMEYV